MLRSISHNPILSHIPPATQMPKEANVRTGLAFSDNLHADPKKDKLLEQMEAFVDNIGEIKEKIEMELTLDNVMEYKNTVKSFLNFTLIMYCNIKISCLVIRVMAIHRK